MKTSLILTLILLAFGHQIYAAGQVSIGIVLGEVSKDINAPLALGGLLATLFGLGQAVASGLAGWILRLRGSKFTFILGMGVFSLFTFLTGLTKTFWDASIYRIAFGIGQGFWNVAYYSTIGILFVERRGLANALLGVMYAVGAFWGAPATAFMLVWSGDWRTSFYFLGVLGFAVSAVIAFAVRPDVLKRSELQVVTKVEEAEFYLAVLKVRNIALGCITGVFYALTFASIFALYPTYLRVVLKLDPVASGVIMSLQTWAWIGAAPILLVLSDRFGRKRFLYYSGLFSAFAIYYMFHLPPENFALAAVASFIYGLTGAGMYPLLMAFTQDSVAQGKIGVSIGFVNFFIYIGVTAAGPITGYIVSLHGWAFASYWLAACSIGIFTATLLARETKIHSRTR